MRSRTLMLLLLAVILAGGTAWLARTWLAAERSKEIAEGPSVTLQTPSRSVLVARADIRRGQILRPEDMVWQIWPEGALDKNYVVLGGPKTPDSFIGWVAKNPINGGEPVTETKIIAPGSRGFLAAVLRPGMRAISVPVSITAGISGFIFPGDQVDLLPTYAVPVRGGGGGGGTQGGGEAAHKAAETVLHDVRVIAIDQRLESKPGEAVVAHTVTFEVTPKQTEIIAVAQELQGAKLTLALRSLVPDPAATQLKADADVREPAATAARGTAAERVSLASASPGPAIQAAAIVADGATGAAKPAAATAGTRLAANDSPGSAAPAPMTPGGGPRVVTPRPIGSDNSTAQSATYTTDNEISSLLPPLRGGQSEDANEELFVCKGPALSCNNRKTAGQLLLIEPARAARDLEETRAGRSIVGNRLGGPSANQ